MTYLASHTHKPLGIPCNSCPSGHALHEGSFHRGPLCARERGVMLRSNMPVLFPNHTRSLSKSRGERAGQVRTLRAGCPPVRYLPHAHLWRQLHHAPNSVCRAKPEGTTAVSWEGNEYNIETRGVFAPVRSSGQTRANKKPTSYTRSTLGPCGCFILRWGTNRYDNVILNHRLQRRVFWVLGWGELEAKRFSPT